MTSRGCAFNCYFCNNIERAQKVRFRSPENVVRELEEINKIEIKDVIFFDENFTLDIKRVEEICDIIIGKKLKIKWQCRSRADMKLNLNLLGKMKKAGCRMIQFGIEAGSQRIQKVINKNLNLENVSKLLKNVKKAGILIYGNLMIGHPTETKEEMEETLEFALKTKMDYISISIFGPLPKTVFYEQGIKDNVIKADYWYEYIKNPKDPIPIFWPTHDKDFLVNLQAEFYRRFYFRIGYIFRSIFIRQSIKQKIHQIRASLRSIF